MKKGFKLLLVTICLTAGMFVYQSCNKTTLINNYENIDNSPVVASVKGRVLDSDGKPVANAKVNAGGTAATTDINGDFSIPNCTINKNYGIITVAKDSFFTGYRTILVNAGKQHYIEFKLLKKEVKGTINAVTGGSLTFADGVKLTLPSAPVVYAGTSQVYTGKIQVAEAYINPLASDLALIMPGDLRGINAGGSERLLQSFGMVAIEMMDENGAILQLEEGQQATLGFKIPTVLLAKAPETIPLWFFDTARGVWQEEGNAMKSNDGWYSGSIKHLSFWNVDIGQPLVNFTVKFIDQLNKPVKLAKVKMSSVNTNEFSYAYTDSAGVVTGKIFQASNMKLDLYSACGNIIYTKNFVTAASDISLDTIKVTNQNSIIVIKGNVQDCAGDTVTNGYVQINVGGNYYNAALNTVGDFAMPINFCGASSSAILTAVDLKGFQQSNPISVTLTADTTNAGIVTACGVNIGQFITYTIGGVTKTLAFPTDTSVAKFASFTTITGNTKPASTSNFINIAFTGNASTAGTHVLKTFYAAGADSVNQNALTIPVTLTEYGAVNQFISGNFSGAVIDTVGGVATPTSVNVKFRVKRNQ